MRDLRTVDYVIGAVGIIGALEILGFFGEYSFVPGRYFLVLSLGIVSIVLILFFVEWLANTLIAAARRRYLFYIFTNTLPAVALAIKYVSE